MQSLKSTVGLLVSVAALSVSGLSASAEVLSPAGHDFVEEGSAGPWKIYADMQRKSCLIEGMDGSGNVVQMGLTSDHNLGYVGVFTQSDVGVNAGAKQEITIEVNGNLYSGTAMMREHGVSDGYQGGYFVANNPNFVADLATGSSLIAFANNGGEGVAVDLSGSSAALEAARACTQKVAAQ